MFATGTGLDELLDLDGHPLGGLPTGIVSVYDISENVSAGTEFMGRVLASNPDATLVWLDVSRQFCPASWSRFAKALGITSHIVLVNDLHWDSHSLVSVYEAFEAAKGGELIIVVDALPALHDAGERGRANEAVAALDRLRIASILLVGTYPVAHFGDSLARAWAVGHYALRERAALSLSVDQRGPSIGVRVDSSRVSEPGEEWTWYEAAWHVAG